MRPSTDPTKEVPTMELSLSQERGLRHQRRAKQMPQAEVRTTIMLKNIPASYSRSRVVKLLEDQGFRQIFDFVYLPRVFETGRILGYALVNLVSPLMAQVFMEWF